MIILTGGAGFIGSNYARFLNTKGYKNIVIIDNFKDTRKFININDIEVLDLIQKENLFDSEFLDKNLNQIEQIIHLGACSSTQENNGIYLLKNNYEYSKSLFHFSVENKIPFIYAPSASVYGLGEQGFKENINKLRPINGYAFSKNIFDKYVLRIFNDKNISSQVAGLRFFNVYGPGEFHKEKMSSPILKFYEQLRESGTCNIFGSYGGFEPGQHSRDFVHVDDCSKVIYFLQQRKTDHIIYNVGTGKSYTFKEIAEIILKHKDLPYESIKYIDFPNSLKGKYQCFTCADLENLKRSGYNNEFKGIYEGVKNYLEFLDNIYE